MLDDPILKHTLYAVLIIVASAFIGQLIKLLFNTVIKKLLSMTKTTLDDRILDVVRGRVITLSVIAGFHIGIKEVRKGLTAELVTYHQILDYLEIALFFLLVFVLTRLVSRIIETIFEWYMGEVSTKTKTNIRPTVAPMVTKLIDMLLFLIAGVIVLDHFGINIGSLLVSLGVGSLAIALAAQETVANMIAGFVILIDQPFRTGDRIKLPTGEEGDVFQIGLRSTRILNFDNNLVILPNSELVKNRVINYSFPDENVRVLVEVGVAYGTDIGKAKEILFSLAAKQTDIINDPPPGVHLVNFNDSSLQLRLSGRTSDFTKKFEIETSLREQIYKSFADAGIVIALPQRVVTINQKS